MPAIQSLYGLVLVVSVSALLCWPFNTWAIQPDHFEITARHVDMPADRYLDARSAAISGNYAYALQEYERLMSEEPDNVDYMLAYAQVLYWSRQYSRALPFLVKARTQAPDYEDIWQLELSVRRALTSDLPESDLVKFLHDARLQFPDAEWHRRQAQGAAQKYRWELAAGREHLDNGTPDWQYLNILLGRKFSARAVATLTFANVSRFDQTDKSAGAGGSLPVGDHWTVAGSITTSSSPAFMPKLATDLQLARNIDGGWVATAKWRRRDYGEAVVTTVGMAAEKYVGRYRFAYSLDSSHLDTEQAFVHVVAANYYAKSGSQFGLVLAAGEEIEAVDIGQLIRTDTSSIVLTGRHPVAGKLSVGWQIGTHRQGQLYRRNAIGMSISGEF